MTAARLVLVVEDSALLRRSICRLLNRRGYATVAAESGEAALEVCAGLPEAPALALVDLHLRDLDGVATIDRLRERFPDLRAVLTTGGDVVIEPALRCGLLRKPWTVAELEAAVTEALRT